MATSSSDESCSAPTDFNVFSSLEELNARSSLLFDKCPLCYKSRRAFYCSNCINSGDFFYSNSRYPERFAEKKLQLYKLKKERLKLLDSVNEIYNHKIRVSQLKHDTMVLKEHISQLSFALEESKVALQGAKDEIVLLEDNSCEHKARLPTFNDKICKMEKFIVQLRSKTSRQNTHLNKMQTELKELCKIKIDQLVEFIFPVKEIRQSKSEVDSSTEDTVNALAEATRMAYIRGHWVYTDNNSDVQYCVVEPLLPGNGDYSEYPMWVATNKEALPGVAVGHNNPAHAITAGLTYIAQMTYIISVFLGVNLPHRMCYSDFCTQELNEEKFGRKTTKLNMNILHLCFSQNVNPELLHPRHTVRNLLLLLNSEASNFGWIGPFIVNPELMQSMEDSLASDLNMSDSSDENSDENDFISEWEKVHNISYEEMTSVPTRVSMSATTTVHSHTQARHCTQPQTTTSVAGGLVTSAAASVASWWRAALGK